MRKDLLVALLLAAILVTSGCMDSSSEESEQPTNEVAEDVPSEVEDADVAVMVGEMYFNQAGIEEENIVEAEEGDEIVFYNEGTMEHTVTIEELGVDEEIGTGETVTVEADEELEEALLECTYHGGHEGEITVS